jgi:hypothetical protein
MTTKTHPAVTLDREQDFSQKIVIVLNKNLETWQAFNTASHIAAYIGNQLGNDFNTGQFFVTKDGTQYPRNTQYAIILLKAKPAQLANLLAKARQTNLIFNAFIREMIDTTDDREIVHTLSTKDSADVGYLGVGLFGPIAEVDTLTKGYRLLS